MSRDPNAVSYIARKNNWKNIIFFGVTTLLALVGVPWYTMTYGVKPVDIFLFVFMSVTTMMATTLGHHRLFAHKSFKAHPLVEFLSLFFGAAAFEGSVINWASNHRDHHRFTDTDKDPYNIKRGFWFAHINWFLMYKYEADLSNAKDLSSKPLIKFQHDAWILWAVTAGIFFPLLIGALAGSFWGAFFWGVCARLFFIHHCVFFINSACHLIGKPTYGKDLSARDSLLCALLTHGEGYHSYHHRFPTDYRNGIKWYHWDPTKWLVRALSAVGLTRDLVRTPEPLILQARAEQEKMSVLAYLNKKQPAAALNIQDLMNHVHTEYDRLVEKYQAWEKAREKWDFEKAKRDYLVFRRHWLEQIARVKAGLLPA